MSGLSSPVPSLPRASALAASWACQHSIGVGFIVIVRIRELANPILAVPVGDPDRPGAGAAAVPELYAAGDADPIRLAADSKAQPAASRLEPGVSDSSHHP